MTLAELFPKGYLVAQAWHKWFDSARPPFSSIDDLHDWHKSWAALVEHEWRLTGFYHVPQAFDDWATTILGFHDDPKRKPLPSRFIWENADESLLREVTADRTKIARALRVSDPVAGLFVLTGWLEKKEEWIQMLREAKQTGEERARLSERIRKALDGDEQAFTEVESLVNHQKGHLKGQPCQCPVCREIDRAIRSKAQAQHPSQADLANDPLLGATAYAEALLEFNETKTARRLQELIGEPSSPQPQGAEENCRTDLGQSNVTQPTTVALDAGSETVAPLIERFLAREPANWHGTIDGEQELRNPYVTTSIYEDRGLQFVGGADEPVEDWRDSPNWRLWPRPLPNTHPDIVIRAELWRGGDKQASGVAIGYLQFLKLAEKRWEAEVVAAPLPCAVELMSRTRDHLRKRYPQPAPMGSEKPTEVRTDSGEGTYDVLEASMKDVGAQRQVVRLPIKLPTRGKDLQRWKQTWDELFKNRQTDKSDKEMLDWLKQHRPRLRCSKDTLEKILRAGRLEELDKVVIEATPE